MTPWPHRLTRAGAVLVAIVACAWFVLGVRQSSGLDRAEAIVGTQPHALTQRQTAEAAGALDEAETLNPDRQVTLERALLALERGQVARARSLAARVTAAEPQNLAGWVTLARTAATDPSLFKRAARHVKRLEPRQP